MTKLPNPHDFYVSTPIYNSFKLNKINYGDLIAIHFFLGPLDIFCPSCGKESVFMGSRELPQAFLLSNDIVSPPSVEDLLNYQDVWLSEDGRNYHQWNLCEYALSKKTIINRFVCSRNSDHILEFVLKTENEIFQKIGQWPSIADLQIQDMKKYQKALGDNYSEFSKAIGLSAHGVGIGSFVYLRRIFENLIELARKEAKEGARWDDALFCKSRMHEKIELLKDHLPSFLVENRIVYSILSVGIHELTEQQCLKYFEAIKLAIEIILDEKIENQLRAEKSSAARKTLSSIKSDISAPASQ